MEMLRTRWEWFVERAHGAHAKVWLVVLSFTESSIFIIPPDFLLAAILLAGSERWLYYSIITTAASIAGAVFGYVIAALFFNIIGEPLINFYHWHEEVAAVKVMFERDAFVAVLVGAFTPIPYKVFVLAAGFLRIDFFVFLIASIIGRSMRYVGLAFGVHMLGERMMALVQRYSMLAAVIAALLLVAYAARHFLM